MNTIINGYIKRPILLDGISSLIIFLCGKYISVFKFTLTSKEMQLNLLSNVIGTQVSLAGFILAALTIIVTFKSNISVRGMDEASNGMELIFSSNHYKSVKRVFKTSIKEFCIMFAILYCIWAGAENIDIVNINLINVCAIVITASVIFRTLSVLFKVIDLDETTFNPRVGPQS